MRSDNPLSVTNSHGRIIPFPRRTEKMLGSLHFYRVTLGRGYGERGLPMVKMRTGYPDLKL